LQLSERGGRIDGEETLGRGDRQRDDAAARGLLGLAQVGVSGIDGERPTAVFPRAPGVAGAKLVPALFEAQSGAVVVDLGQVEAITRAPGDLRVVGAEVEVA
jgi:hypothetical protein